MDFDKRLIGRFNRLIRSTLILPRMRNRLKKEDFTLLCNNCLAGVVYHDLGLKFLSPTINMYFHSLDFLDFIEYYDFYIDKMLIPIKNPKYNSEDPDYPVAILQGDSNHKDLELHFLHYKTFSDAQSSWERRKARINKSSIFVVFSFVGLGYDRETYERCEQLPLRIKCFLLIIV